MNHPLEIPEILLKVITHGFFDFQFFKDKMKLFKYFEDQSSYKRKQDGSFKRTTIRIPIYRETISVEKALLMSNKTSNRILTAFNLRLSFGEEIQNNEVYAYIVMAHKLRMVSVAFRDIVDYFIQKHLTRFIPQPYGRFNPKDMTIPKTLQYKPKKVDD